MAKVLFYSILCLFGVAALFVVATKFHRKAALLTVRLLTVFYLLMNLYYTFFSRVNVSQHPLQELIAQFVEGVLSSPQQATFLERFLASALQILFVFSPESYLLGCLLNLLLYLPLGYLLLCALPRLRDRWLLVVGLGFAASCLTEGAQWYTGLGVADVMDLVCNTAGTLLGALAYRRWLAGRWRTVE